MSELRENKKITILMIDDDLMLLKLYEMTARTQEEIAFLTTTNTVEGDRIAREQKPDVILLDLILGKEPNTPVTEVDKNHGFNFLIMLRSDPETKDIPVIILSNLDTKQDYERAKELQAEDYIVKAKTTPDEVLERAKGAADIAAAEKKIRKVKDEL
ncbi:MAG: response regulator [Candidatus Andersenbacteria bacterium]